MTSPTEALIHEIERFLHASRAIGGQGCLSTDLLPHLSRLRDLSTEIEAHIQQTPEQSDDYTDSQIYESTESHLYHDDLLQSDTWSVQNRSDQQVQPIPLGFEDNTTLDIPKSPPLVTESQALQALEHCSKLIPTLTDAVKCLSFSATPWLRQDHRLSHVTLLNRMQGQRTTSTITSVERILAVLGSMSLANDYRTFERVSGWQPKHDQLLQSILEGSEPGYARIPDHFKNFTASLGVVERGKLATSLKFGAKVNLVQALTDPSSYGPGLALLMGFECRKLSRVPYRELSLLKRLVGEDPRFESCRKFCQNVGTWYIKQQREYSLIFSPSSSNDAAAQHSFNAVSQANVDGVQELVSPGDSPFQDLSPYQAGWEALENAEQSPFPWSLHSTPIHSVLANMDS